MILLFVSILHSIPFSILVMVSTDTQALRASSALLIKVLASYLFQIVAFGHWYTQLGLTVTVLMLWTPCPFEYLIIRIASYPCIDATVWSDNRFPILGYYAILFL